MCCQLLLEAVSVSSPHVLEAYEATGSLGWPCVSCRPGVLCSVSPLSQADGPVWALPLSLNTHRLLSFCFGAGVHGPAQLGRSHVPASSWLGPMGRHGSGWDAHPTSREGSEWKRAVTQHGDLGLDKGSWKTV